ncbi:hypothetical protein HNR60_001545 [Rhodopseudomonas rhenobacensis]|uniref:Uncharacterized protein n=1 Tax=Rhodopseudomonas rhenobacensis TaxID=87461 RepID=A0A7W7Z350_9BRAD|nr:hypothetical protein [Rhodopseudomonas rhenobacensis]MBB5046797.1 hypothetical protein [Rhodopseudomonas rhenobacensis]
MATKKSTADVAATPEIIADAYYAVEVSARFKAFGVGFGQASQTQVTGELLTRLLASEHAAEVASYTPV